jgi:S-adenosylmethionine hydrolase
MIVLFTDFGLEGPYVGQMKAALLREAPGVPVIDLFADLPPFDPQAAAYLLAAYAREFPAGAVFLCVIDPGVGGARRPLILEADGQRFVGPDNGLFEIVRRRAAHAAAHEIRWRPERLSASFHGRDLFAPAAARLARGLSLKTAPLRADAIARPEWPDDLARIVYVDRFGNAMTGLRASIATGTATLVAGSRELDHARTFGDVPEGGAFWYENANGLIEIAVNQGRADRALGLTPGDPVELRDFA